jgi:REP element-mobilizing transposase RayT
MAHTYPKAQIHCVFSTLARRASFPDALLEKISLFLIGIGRNRSRPILCARASAQHVHLLIAVPRDLTLARAMLLLKAEFFTLAAKTTIQLIRLLTPVHRKSVQICSDKCLFRSSARGSRKAVVEM